LRKAGAGTIRTNFAVRIATKFFYQWPFSFSVIGQASAATPTDPVILIYRGTAEFKGGETAGVIGSIIESPKNT
jgi:hypothetical protein